MSVLWQSSASLPRGGPGRRKRNPPAAGDLPQAGAAKTPQTTPRGEVREAKVGVERERVESFGRMEDGLRQAGSWYLWGPYLSERQWGTVREDYSAGRRGMELPAARPCPLSGLPVGRGRAGRFQRRRAAAVPGAGAVERAGPDPQGADLRVDRRRGQSRRGRQGVLVVPRRRPQPRLEPLALPLPAACVPLRASAGGERPARQAGPGIRAAGHRRLRRRPLLGGRGALREGRTAKTC